MTRQTTALIIALMFALLAIGCGEYDENDDSLSEDDYALEDGDDYMDEGPGFDKNAEATDHAVEQHKLLDQYGEYVYIDQPFQPKKNEQPFDPPFDGDANEDPTYNPQFDRDEEFYDEAEEEYKLLELYGEYIYQDRPDFSPKKVNPTDPPIESEDIEEAFYDDPEEMNKLEQLWNNNNSADLPYPDFKK